MVRGSPQAQTLPPNHVFQGSLWHPATCEAHALAHALLRLGLSFGPLGVLITLYTGTALLTNIISNTATCVMMIPVAAHISEKLQDMEDCHLPLPLGWPWSFCHGTSLGINVWIVL